eukprot:5012532-Lingulodinium_polyedra.AAC.1
MGAWMHKSIVPCQEGQLVVIDEDYRIETAVVAMVSGPQAVPMAVLRVQACLPDAKNDMVPESSLQLLAHLRACSSWRLAPRAAQSLGTW